MDLPRETWTGIHCRRVLFLNLVVKELCERGALSIPNWEGKGTEYRGREIEGKRGNDASEKH